MDPVSVASIVASAIGLADIATRLGRRLWDLREEFDGALEHIDNIFRYTKTIDLTIRAICTFLDSRPDTFSPSFKAHFNDSTTAIDKIIQQIQTHIQSIRDDVERSPSKGKARHVLNVHKVEQWEKALAAQTQALALLVSVAQLQTPRERMSALEQASSKILFERASSMSAKLAKSSCDESLGGVHQSGLQEFSFDPILMETKVYRRVAVSWIRQLCLSGEAKEPNMTNDFPPTIPVSSSSAVAGPSNQPSLLELPSPSTCNSQERTHATLPFATGLDTAEEVDPRNLRPNTISPEASGGTSSGERSASSGERITKSTLRTTISSMTSDGTNSTSVRDRDFGVVKIGVDVDGIGRDSAELLICKVPNPYATVQDVIRQLKDGVLQAAGIEPNDYGGTCVKSTIETHGQGNHHFPFDQRFLTAAIEKLKEGFYTSFEILACFASPGKTGDFRISIRASLPTQSDLDIQRGKHTTTQMLQITGSEKGLLYYPIHSDVILPFIEDPDQPCRIIGGFSQVFKVKIHTRYQDILPDGGKSPYFALKVLNSKERRTFKNELNILRELSGRDHPHIVKLLASYRHQDRYHLLFPWGRGNLLDLWKQHPGSNLTLPSIRIKERALWMTEQWLGIVEALSQVHLHLNATNTSRDSTEEDPSRTYGRHGDIKPANILWFPGGDHLGTLKIADFGLSQYHQPSPSFKDTRERNLQCTTAYRPPECDLNRSSRHLSSAFDIWSLGCVFLEFMTWYALGWDGVCEFKRTRNMHATDNAFFILTEGQAVLSPSAFKQIQALQERVPDHCPQSLAPLGLLVRCLSMCLEIAISERPSAAATTAYLRGVCDKLGIKRSKCYEDIYAETMQDGSKAYESPLEPVSNAERKKSGQEKEGEII